MRDFRGPALCMGFLWVAALRNPRTYEKRYFWFLIGTLHALEAQQSAAPAPAARRRPWVPRP